MTQEFLPDPKALDTFDMEDMDELLENMLRKMFGGKSPERTETNASPTQTNDEQYATRFCEEEDLASVSRLLRLLQPTSKTETQVSQKIHNQNLTMTSPYDRLGISSSATAEIKAAYHAKLKEFPAHRHPEEFKA